MKNQIIKVPDINAGKPEISMAPLIDVVFLLLIFFMVTTVFPENRGIAIQQPDAKSSERLPAEKITFLLTNENIVFYKDKEVSFSDVKRIVEQQLALSANTAILLKIDKLANAQSIISTMDACKEAGAQRIGIATKKSHETSFANPSLVDP